MTDIPEVAPSFGVNSEEKPEITKNVYQVNKNEREKKLRYGLLSDNLAHIILLNLM